jgi:hypothetical protein
LLSSSTLFRNYVDTAFLKRYGPDYIPWMLVISALLTMVVLAYANRIAKRFSDTYLMTLVLGGYAAGVTLCWLMVKSRFTIVYPMLYQLMGLLDSILLVYLWNIAVTARQASARPHQTAAQVLGTTVGSLRPTDHHCDGEDGASGLCSGLPFAALSWSSRGHRGSEAEKTAADTVEKNDWLKSRH